MPILPMGTLASGVFMTAFTTGAKGLETSPSRSARAKTRSLSFIPRRSLFRCLITVFSQGISIMLGHTSVHREQVVQSPLISLAEAGPLVIQVQAQPRPPG